MKTQNYLALDFGAGSGRGIVGSFDGTKLRTEELFRFDHFFNVLNGKTYWDVLELNRQTKNVLKKAAAGEIALEESVVIPGPVDYGLWTGTGICWEIVISYRMPTEENV